MKNKLGILSALVLSLAIAGSAFAANQDTQQPGSSSTTGMQKMSKKHHKAKKHHKSMKKTSSRKSTKKSSTPSSK